MNDTMRAAALDYHRFPQPGKISVTPTKAMASARDLALAYSPGVAEACMAIAGEASEVAQLTARSNLVAVVTNGTAVLGLGNIGPLASKPVMEGKACLFKKFAGIDVFDIELAENDPDLLVDTIARMEPTFGGINLEDIKAPECFYIERKLRERMKIPVFHDDQHGTAIVAAAAILNALELVGKSLSEVSVACSGAGAAAIACLDLLVSLGMRREQITLCDSRGVVHTGRGALDETKARYARDTAARTLTDACEGADIFLGLSQAGVLTPAMVATMARAPLILAMANPTPEIMPHEALAVRPDAIIGTGRSDHPNQVNNVLAFPFIFRGALDAGATTINEEMKLAAVHAIAALAREAVPQAVLQAYPGEDLGFGPGYLIPKPFDPRLIEVVAPAVAQAAMESGVATRPILDMAAYRQRLSRVAQADAAPAAPALLQSNATLSPEQRAACTPIEQYFLGHARDDAAHMRQAFLPTAHIESMREGQFTSWPLDVYCERFKGQPQADEATRVRTIDWIEVTGNAACARITLHHGATTFTDYFVLLRTAEGWKIANKAFHGEARAA